jgi:hypothetical protein
MRGNAYKMLFEEYEDGQPFGRPICKLEDNI